MYRLVIYYWTQTQYRIRPTTPSLGHSQKLTTRIMMNAKRRGEAYQIRKTKIIHCWNHD